MKKIILPSIILIVACCFLCIQDSSASGIIYSYDNTYQLTGAAFTNSTSSASYTYDRSGNRSTYIESAPDHDGQSTAPVSSSIDTPRSIYFSNISSPFNSPRNNKITGRGFGNASTIQKVDISTDGGQNWTQATTTDSWNTWKYDWSPMPADGKYYLMSRATSTTNEVENFNTALTVYVDQTRPTGKITYPTNGMILSGTSCTIAGTADDGLGVGILKVQVSIDNGVTWADATDASGPLADWSKWECIIPISANVPYIIRSRAIDKAGNIESDPQKVTTACSTVWAWGINYDGQLGNNQGRDWLFSSNPVKALSTSTLLVDGVIKMACGRESSYVLKSDGTVWSTGADGDSHTYIDHYGQLGLGVNAPINTYTYGAPVVGINGIGTLSGVKDISSGVYFAVALLNDGTVVAWGKNDYGQLGISTVTTMIPYPIKVQGLSNIVAISAGGNYAAALDSSGVLWVWGQNNDGQLGIGSTTSCYTPTAVAISGIKRISCGYRHTLVLKTDGTLWGWGIRAYLNGGATNNYYTSPVQLTPDGLLQSKYTDISAGYEHSLLLRDDGSVWAFGYNSYGELGNGVSSGNFGVKKQDITGTIKTLAAGNYFSAVLKMDGTVWAWGINQYGAIGQGTGGQCPNICTPTQVRTQNGGPAFTNVESIATGYNHILALKKSGPSSYISAPVGGYLGNSNLINSTYKIQVVASDDNVNGIKEVFVSFDGGTIWLPAAYNATSDKWEYVWAAPGNDTYSLLCKAIDEIGNEELPKPAIVIKVDTTPSIVGIKPLSNIVKGSLLNISGYSDDGLDSGVNSVQISTDGGASWAADVTDITPARENKPWGAWEYNWPLPNDGHYALQAKATDMAGNVSYSSISDVIVDNTPPTGSIVINNGAQFTTSGDVNLAISATDANGVATMQISEDGIFDAEPWEPYAASKNWTFNPATQGIKTIKTKFTDVAGNVSEEYSYTITFDSIKPESTLSAPADGALLNGSICTITGIASDSGSGIQKVEVGVTPNGGSTTWYPATGTTNWSCSWSLTGDGSYLIQSRATDNAGNVEIPRTGVGVTVDITPPESIITSPVGGAIITSATYTINGTVSDGVAGVQKVEVGITPSGGTTAWYTAAGTNSWTYSCTAISEGSYTIQSRATDNAGNIENPGAGVPVTAFFIKRVSVKSDGTQAGGGYSSTPSVSADGRYIAFFGNVKTLVPGDTNLLEDVFVKDCQTGVVERVSVATDGSQAVGGGSLHPFISADGRYVVFDSDATNLVTGDTNGYKDIFVHDRQTGVTERVNVATDGTEAIGGGSFSPAISLDGRYVAFCSAATNLVANDINGAWDMFVHDRKTGVTERVSVASDGTPENGNASDIPPAISPDGRYVAFASLATNLVPNDSVANEDMFVHDRQTGETICISRAIGGTESTTGHSLYPFFSANGKFIAFSSGATNLVSNDANSLTDVFVHELQTGLTERVSVDSGSSQAVGGHSQIPTISADGRYVVFYSLATNLVPDDTNGVFDAFVHDRQTGITKRVSVAADGNQGNLKSEFPRITADGKFIAFRSDATNLISGDTNALMDVFLVGNPTYSTPTALYSLTTQVNLEGSGTVTTTGESPYAPGTLVSLTATPAEGYSFLNWSDGVMDTTSPTTTVMMYSDRTVTANFIENTP